MNCFLIRFQEIECVESLWDSIASEPGGVPLPEHHKTILDERLKTLDEDTEKGEPYFARGSEISLFLRMPVEKGEP